ncbi:hypothetical protein [Kitasatospora sp. McL0602]|uniref:hypothetical protein n=1 Tax=Kitasatospora sp. McL0602 TaxID=3439530 RepID=UPI003F895D4B
MAGASFQIDLEEVESAAKLIRSMLDDLAEPANHLEAVVKQVQKSVYGSDLLGKSLTGGSSSVGGVDVHQQQVLEGIRSYLTNSGAMAANLLQMVESHRLTDGQNSQDLDKILKDGGSGSGSGSSPASPPPPSSPPPAPVSAPTPIKDKDPGYVPPAAPTLDYNHPNPLFPGRPPVGGGGSHHSEI